MYCTAPALCRWVYLLYDICKLYDTMCLTHFTKMLQIYVKHMSSKFALIKSVAVNWKVHMLVPVMIHGGTTHNIKL